MLNPIFMNFINCVNCGREMPAKEVKCPHCNYERFTMIDKEPLQIHTEPNVTQSKDQQIIYVLQSGNSVGTAGFVLAVLAIVLCWIPGLNVVLWILGFIFSMAAVFKTPRGYAITGLILSLIGLLALIVAFNTLTDLFTELIKDYI